MPAAIDGARVGATSFTAQLQLIGKARIVKKYSKINDEEFFLLFKPANAN